MQRTLTTPPSSSEDPGAPADQQIIRVRCAILTTERPFQAAGDQLRRCITAIFPDEPVLHNHEGEHGRFLAPRVRYLVVDGLPMVVGIEEGIDVVARIYERPSLVLNDRRGHCAVIGRELRDDHDYVGVMESYTIYTSFSPWLGLNEGNFQAYSTSPDPKARAALLARCFVNNVLGTLKSLGVRVQSRVEAQLLWYDELPVTHKQTGFLGFSVDVKTNALLHPWLGIGKLVSKGFGLFAFDETHHYGE